MGIFFKLLVSNIAMANNARTMGICIVYLGLQLNGPINIDVPSVSFTKRGNTGIRLVNGEFNNAYRSLRFHRGTEQVPG